MYTCLGTLVNQLGAAGTALRNLLSPYESGMNQKSTRGITNIAICAQSKKHFSTHPHSY